MASKIKILVFQTHLVTGTGGGIRVYCNSLAELFQDDPIYNVKVCPILPEATKLLGNKYDVSAVLRYIEEENPEIIHINGYTSLIISQLVPLAKKNKIHIIYTPHWHPFETMKLSVLKGLHFKMFVKPYLKDIESIICINNEEKDFFSKYNGNVNLIPHWNLGKISRDPKIEKKKNMILFIGNLFYKNKGFHHLFSLPEGKYSIHCVGRGKVALRSDMIQHQDLSINELNELYNQASLVVVPSHYEAFSYTSLEALACETPIVVSQNVRFADYLPDNNACRIFEYGNYTDFNNKVREAIGYQFDYKSIIEQFSKTEAKEKYINVYKSVIK